MSKDNFTAKVNEVFEFDQLDPKQLDIIPMGDGQFHIIKEHKTYKASVEHVDFNQKLIDLNINGNTYKVALKDQYDHLVQKLGLSITGGRKIKSINAPMPGLVLEVLVKDGQEFCKGDPLLILEAMKMENVLKAPGDGKVKEILIQQGNAVDKGQLLIDLE